MDGPLVSIGVPTYNRVAGMRRAVESVLAQTYTNWELLISDNASTDDTAEEVARLAASDERISVVTQPRNLGPTGNFNQVLTGRRGDYVLIVADDDWIAPNYLEECVGLLERDPSVAVAGGADVYFRDGEEYVRGPAVDVLHGSPGRRLNDYYAQVYFNATFYGVMRRSAVEPALPMRNALGNDWLLVASVIAAGKARTMPATTINRSLGGSSVDWKRLAEITGLPPERVRHPHLEILKLNVREIARDGDAFAVLGRRRATVALAVAVQIVRHRPMEFLWDALGPLFDRPALRPLREAGARLYWRLRPPGNRA